MHKGSQERGDVFEFSQKANRLPSQPSVKRNARMPAAPRPHPGNLSSTWRSTAIFSLFLLLLLAIGVAFQGFRRATMLQQQLDDTVEAMASSMQELRSTVNFDSVRRKLLLGMRDEILKVNESLSMSEAYDYAELLINVTDRYPSVDPIFLLSIGIVESEYDSRARSRADARGLYQIWPSTGRMLAGMLDWEYKDEMLYDPERNTEMAALYLDVLMSTYNDLGLVLAEYNGGPINAGFYRAGSRRTAAETQDYVPKVLTQYRRLSKKLPMPPGHSYQDVYRNASRAGKTLGEPIQASVHEQVE